MSTKRMNDPRVGVFGAGANGGAIAAALHRNGIRVQAFDPWADHVEASNSHGLTVQSSADTLNTPVEFRHLCQLAELKDTFDVLVLAVKAYDTRWACELLRPYLSPQGTVVAIQNGLTHDTVAEVFGSERTVGAVIEVAANLFTPGHINQQAPIWLALGGENPTAQQRAHEASQLLSHAAQVDVVADIRSAKWMKLVANACELVPSAILDLPLAEAIAQPGMYEFMLRAGDEALQAALATGHHIVPIFGNEITPEDLSPQRYVSHLLSAVLSDYTKPDTLTTVLQDWRKGRRAEIEEINGMVVAVLGEEKAPANAAILDLARQIERGAISASINNLPKLIANYALAHAR